MSGAGIVPLVGHRSEMVEKAAGTRTVFASENRRSRQCKFTQPAQQRGAALEADERIVAGRPGNPALTSRCQLAPRPRHRRAADRADRTRKRRRANMSRLASASPSERPIFAGCGIAIAPCGPAPASSSTLTMARSNAARARSCRSASRRRERSRPSDRDRSPRNAASANGTDVERRIGLARGRERRVGGLRRARPRSTRKWGSLSSSPSASMRLRARRAPPRRSKAKGRRRYHRSYMCRD